MTKFTGAMTEYMVSKHQGGGIEKNMCYTCIIDNEFGHSEYAPVRCGIDGTFAPNDVFNRVILTAHGLSEIRGKSNLLLNAPNEEICKKFNEGNADITCNFHNIFSIDFRVLRSEYSEKSYTIKSVWKHLNRLAVIKIKTKFNKVHSEAEKSFSVSLS